MIVPTEVKRKRQARKTSEASNQFVSLPVVPLRETVALPHMILPLQIARAKSAKAVAAAVERQCPVVLVPQRGDNESPGPEELFTVGVIAGLGQVLRLPTGGMQAIVQGQVRAEGLEVVQSEPYLIARVRQIVESIPDHT